MKNTVRAHNNRGKNQNSIQAKTARFGVIKRAIGYDLVLEFIGEFYYLEHAQNEANGLLDLGASLLRLQAKDSASLKVADDFAALVIEAKHKLRVAVNGTHQAVYNVEPRIDDPWSTTQTESKN